MRSARSRTEAGAAVVDAVFVLVLLTPLVVGIIQVALVMHVRTTLTAAAAEGARRAAVLDGTPADGVRRAAQQWSGVVSEDFVTRTRIEPVEIAGAPGYRVVIDARVPALGLGGPAVAFTATGSAVREMRATNDIAVDAP